MNRKLIKKIRFFIHRRGIGYFAPLIAFIRLIKKRKLNYIWQMKVICRYAFWKVPKYTTFATYTADELIDEFCPGMKDQFEAESLLRKEKFLNSLRPKTARPDDLRELMIFCHDEHCLIRWHTDFEKRELLIFTPSVFVPILTDFLIALPAEDKRFAEFGIEEPLQIDTYFTIKLCLEYQDKEKWYLAHVYMDYGCFDISHEPLPMQ